MSGSSQVASREAAGRMSPRLADIVLGVAVTLLVSLVITADVGGAGSDALAYLWAVGLGALMLVRRRYPVLVVVLSVLGLFAYYAANYPPIGVAVPVAAAVFSAAERGRPTTAAWGASVVLIVSTTYRLAVGRSRLCARLRTGRTRIVARRCHRARGQPAVAARDARSRRRSGGTARRAVSTADRRTDHRRTARNEPRPARLVGPRERCRLAACASCCRGGGPR